MRQYPGFQKQRVQRRGLSAGSLQTSARTWGLTPHCGLGGPQSSYCHMAGPENPS